MRRRLYFGLPNPRIAPAVMNERLLDHIDENHIHVHARHEHLLEQLPKAGAVEISDILHGALACAAWAAAIATAAPGYRLRAHSQQLEQGNILMVVSVPLRRLREIRQRLMLRHPEALYGGVWPAEHRLFP